MKNKQTPLIEEVIIALGGARYAIGGNDNDAIELIEEAIVSLEELEKQRAVAAKLLGEALDWCDGDLEAIELFQIHDFEGDSVVHIDEPTAKARIKTIKKAIKALK